ncbi:serine/threonine protein phosphatase [Aurantibacter crassamenti]|uniref:metallophosphoesterase n=1 Tax=Aurantibacter crassamenti TaxID=1837375 RepID=UPI00193A52B0|nr:metallophosphoesterase [Aurantibacter crassamenti]MBM1104944.1 serine/threonine protein phosphatase [Aurantibacter crassamenti]
MRTLVIGDIHSGLRGLIQVFERAKVTRDDRLVFLGDYVDGWSEAVETVDFLSELDETHQCIFLRGNHDELCLEWLSNDEVNDVWLQHGGQATLDSYRNADESASDLHMMFYEGLRNYFIDENNRLYLHAGFTNLKGVEHEYFAKTFYWDRTLWEMAVSLDKDLTLDSPSYPKRLVHYLEIYIGHTPVTRMGETTPQKAANVWNIDTGAAFKGPLSIIDVDTKEVWQSDPVYLLYPEEKGRN